MSDKSFPPADSNAEAFRNIAARINQPQTEPAAEPTKCECGQPLDTFLFIDATDGCNHSQPNIITPSATRTPVEEPKCAAMVNVEGHLLSILAEECAEVAQRVSKVPVANIGVE